MNARQRLMNVLNNEPVDRVPNLNIVMQFAAHEVGKTYSEYVTDYRVLAEGNIVCAEKYGLDVLSAISDPMREGADLGMDVAIPPDDVPYQNSLLIKELGDLKKLKLVKPEDGPRMSDRVNAVGYMKEKYGNDFAVMGWVEGCFAQAADLRGVNEFLMDLFDEPVFIKELLDFVLEQEILFAKAQIDAGADIIGVGDAIASVAGPMYYKDLAHDYEQKLLGAIQQMGAKTKLHICGNITPFLEYIPTDVCDMVDLDWMVPIDEAKRLFGDSTVICGNYDPVAIMLQSDEAGVDAAVRQCYEAVKTRYISQAGCEVPPATPEKNFLQVKKTLAELAG